MILPILLGLAKELKDLYFDLRHHDEDDSLVDILGGTDNIDSGCGAHYKGLQSCPQCAVADKTRALRLNLQQKRATGYRAFCASAQQLSD